MLSEPRRPISTNLRDTTRAWVLEIIHDKKTDALAMWRIEAGAGLGTDTIRASHYRRGRYGPSIGTVRAALRELGYDLAVVPYRQSNVA